MICNCLFCEIKLSIINSKISSTIIYICNNPASNHSFQFNIESNKISYIYMSDWKSNFRYECKSDFEYNKSEIRIIGYPYIEKGLLYHKVIKPALDMNLLFKCIKSLPNIMTFI